MNLIDILVKELTVWPDDVNYIVSHDSGELWGFNLCPYKDSYHKWVTWNGLDWRRQREPNNVADDHNEAIITKVQWEKAKHEQESKMKSFTKADMKDGMRCVLRNGDEMFWNAKGVEHPMIPGSEDMESYDDDSIEDNLLNDNFYDDSDIMEVYALGELVWKREEENEDQKKLKEIYSAIEKLQEQAKAIVERK